MRLFGTLSAFYKCSNSRILSSNQRFLALGNYALISNEARLFNEDEVSNITRRRFASFTQRRQVLASDMPPVPLVDEPFGKTFLNAIWRHFVDDPQRTAMINAHDERDWISFGQLFINSQSIATFLRTQGFGHGDVCAVVLPNCWQYMAIFGGILTRSGSMSGVNYNFTSYEMKRQFEDSHAKIVFCLENNAETVLNALAENNEVTTVVVVPDTVGSDCGITKLKQRFTANNIKHFNSVLKIKPDNFAQPNVKCNIKSDIVLLPYSSGTTGHPKGVMISHFNFGMMMKTFSHHFAVRILPAVDQKYDYRKETQLDILPFYHIYGIGVIVNHLVNGSTAVIMKSFEAKLFCEMLEKYRCKFVMVVPPIMIFLAKHPLVSNYDFSSLKMTVSGAAPAGKELCEELLKRLPAIEHVVQGYGMTELSLCSHLPVLDDVNRFEKAGKLMPNFELKIVDLKTGNELGPNEPGELCIRSPTVMIGYLGNPTATAETFTKDGFLRTGDIAYVDEEGFLCVVDRLKELIKVSGYQVAPAELEDILLSHPKVHDCAVTGITDEKAGEAPKAFIVKKEGGSSLTAEEIQEYMKDRVVYYKRLKSIEFVDSIPKSPSGKILRRVLRDRANAK